MSVTTSISSESTYSLLYSSTTAAGTPASTTETTLASYTLPANTLVVDNDFIEVRASGSFAANGNTKTVRLKIDSTDILDSGATTINNRRFEVSARIYRGAAASGIASSVITVNGVVTGTFPPTTSLDEKTSLVKSWESDLDIVFTGENGTASLNDIILDSFTVELKRQ